MGWEELQILDRGSAAKEAFLVFKVSRVVWRKRNDKTHIFDEVMSYSVLYQ